MKAWFCTFVLLGLPGVAVPQENLPAPVAAVVNGEPLAESHVQRALRGVPDDQKAKAREEILSFLIDNLLLDQYLRSRNVPAAPEEVENRMKRIMEEAKAKMLTPAQLLAQLMITEKELRAQVAADLRWETYVKTQLDEGKLRSFFNANPEGFNGSRVRARHVFVAVAPDAGPNARAAAQAKLAAIKRAIEQKVATELARVENQTDTTARAEVRLRLLNLVFGDVAGQESECPSKKNGGDLGWFPRLGEMTEAFAAAAFSLQPGQMSDIVVTPFGCHLILVTGREPGREVKFEEVKEEVQEICEDKLRDDLLPGLRKAATIKRTTPGQ